MKLYKIVIFSAASTYAFYVVALDEGAASAAALEKWEERFQALFPYVGEVKLIASEGEPRLPYPLVIQKEKYSGITGTKTTYEESREREGLEEQKG